MIPAILLPGGVLPAALAYPALMQAFGNDIDARAKELELYAGDGPPPDWSLQTEVEGIDRFADAAGFDRFHLVGYSAGGASALTYCAARGERLLSLTLNEPAWAGNEGLSPAELEMRRRFESITSLPPDQMMTAFMRAQVRDEVDLPAPPPGPPPPWMTTRPAGLHAITDAFAASVLDMDRLAAFDRPVLFTLGGKSHPDGYPLIAARLRRVFKDFTLEKFEDRHHFDPPHRTEPERMAKMLRALWDRAAG